MLKGNALLFIFITVTLDAIGLGIIIPVLPELLKEVMNAGIGEAAKWGGILAASYAVTQFLFGPLLGSLSDKVGRRPVLLIGLVVLSVDYIVMGFANTIWLLLLGRLLAGAAGATITIANAFVADISTPDKRAANFGMLGAAFGIGFILGPVVGGLLSGFGTRAPFFVAAALAMLNALYGYFVLPESLLPEKRRAFSLRGSNPLAGILMIRRFPALGWIFLSIFLYGIGHFVYPAIWSYWGVERFDWSPLDIGITLAVVGVGFAAVQGGLIRKAIPRYGETSTAIFSFVIAIAAMVFYAFVSSSTLVYISLLITPLGAMVTPAITGILSNAIPEDEQGMLQGVIAGLTAVATIVSPLMLTSLFYRFSERGDNQLYFPGAPFLMAAILVGLSLIAFVIGVNKAGRVDSKH